MLSKHQLPFPMNFHALPEVNGLALDVGEYQGQPYTALWAEDAESDSSPIYFWPNRLPEGFLSGFFEGLKAAEEKKSIAVKEAYARGRWVGITLVQDGFSMIFGESGRNYVQRVVKEMEREKF